MRVLNPDPEKQEPLLVESVPDPLAGEQVNSVYAPPSICGVSFQLLFFYYKGRCVLLYRFQFVME